jgi:hypothetical protein
MDVVGSFAYLLDSTQGLIIVDVSNPDNLVQRGTLPFQDFLTGDLRVCNGIAYVVESGFLTTTSLRINDANVLERIALVDVSDVDHPQRLGVTPPRWQELYDIACVGTTIYVGSPGGITIVDVSNPAQPTIVDNYSPTGPVYGMVVVSPTVYVAQDSEGLKILNASDPRHPVEDGRYQPYPIGSSCATGVAIADRWAYLASTDSNCTSIVRSARIDIVDVSNPAKPQWRYRSSLWGSLQAAGDLLVISGEQVTIVRARPEELPSPVWLPLIQRPT